MPEDVRYPTERLGSKPGSFGSYVGVDHDTPIITLEFTSHDKLDLFEQLDAVDLAIEAAASWTAENAGLSMPDSASALAEDETGFSTTLFAQSAGKLPIRMERREGTNPLSVMLLSGLGPISQDSLLVAEHIRRVLLSDAPNVDLTMLTGVSPDGLRTLRSINQQGVEIVNDFVRNREILRHGHCIRCSPVSNPAYLFGCVLVTWMAFTWTGPSIHSSYRLNWKCAHLQAAMS